jgi:tRNA threonylcarbamoyladenosine biosynthesis protein TsaB
MVRVLDVPFFAYSGLQALAAGVGAGVGARGSAGGETGARPICALLDARREEVYAACYDFSGTSIETILEPTVLPLGEVLEELRGVAPIYAGDGALRYREAIEGAGGGVAPAFFAVPRGGALLWLADSDPAAGRIDDPAAWEPEYLRAAGAERGAPR